MSRAHHLPTGNLLDALRGAACPSSALHIYSLLRVWLRSSDPSSFGWRAAVLALKPLSSAASLPLISHFHGHLLKSNLLAYPHVASSLLRSYSVLSPSAAHQLFDQTPPATCNLYVLNVMLSSLCRSSDLDSARAFFDDIPDKDVVSWSTMLACYFSHGRIADGFAFFRTMTFTTEITADYVMLVTILTACASSGLLQPFCRAVHGFVVRHSIPASMHLGTALIDCYAKAGRLDCASRVFARVPSRNVMHWTAMICGMAAHLRNKEAVRLFEEMCRRRMQPNEMTFTAVLSSCGQAGMVEKGREIFKLMVDKYDLEPNIHHYGCMVDLYAKAGQLEDAYEVIKTMRVEPNVIIWTSLLAACKKFKNFNIAVEGMEKAMAMEISDENAGLYMLISDLYAMGGRWDDVMKVRRLMEEQNVRKNRGLSSIRVDETQGSSVSLTTGELRQTSIIRWSAPPDGILKVNTDAAFSAEESTGATGVVIRDSAGNFIKGSAKRLSVVASALIAEAEACRTGLQLISGEWHNGVILETDSKTLVDLWCAKNGQRSEIATILSDIQELSNSFSSFSLNFVKRSANWAAHGCAQFAVRHRVNHVWVSQPPDFLLQCLQDDCNPYD
ncbi:hypothetical protein ACP70R_038491 [Stipagrostis hirtigluma subsp. patula]